MAGKRSNFCEFSEKSKFCNCESRFWGKNATKDIGLSRASSLDNYLQDSMQCVSVCHTLADPEGQRARALGGGDKFKKGTRNSENSSAFASLRSNK